MIDFRPILDQVKDDLTGLLNWNAFRLLVEHELRVAKRARRSDALLVIAVTELQTIYDAGGITEGNETVRAIARVLSETARDSDIVGRIGRDAFAVFALDCEGEILANRIATAVANAAEHASAASSGVAGARAFNVGLSIGITEVRGDDEFDPLMARALTVLPRGKRSNNGAAARV